MPIYILVSSFLIQKCWGPAVSFDTSFSLEKKKPVFPIKHRGIFKLTVFSWLYQRLLIKDPFLCLLLFHLVLILTQQVLFNFILCSQNNITPSKKGHMKYKFSQFFYEGKYFVHFFPSVTGFATLEMMENIACTYYFEYHFFPTFGGILSNKTVISTSFLPTYSLYLFEAESQPVLIWIEELNVLWYFLFPEFTIQNWLISSIFVLHRPRISHLVNINSLWLDNYTLQVVLIMVL